MCLSSFTNNLNLTTQHVEEIAHKLTNRISEKLEQAKQRSSDTEVSFRKEIMSVKEAIEVAKADLERLRLIQQDLLRVKMVKGMRVDVWVWLDEVIIDEEAFKQISVTESAKWGKCKETNEKDVKQPEQTKKKAGFMQSFVNKFSFKKQKKVKDTEAER